MEMKVQSPGVGECDPEAAEKGSKNGCKMTRVRRLGRHGWECPTDGRPEGAALKSAGSMGDVVREPDVGETIEFGEAIRFLVTRIHQGQGASPSLPETRLEEGLEIGPIPDAALLPGCLEPARMAEPAHRKCRVRQLPEDPLAGTPVHGKG